MADEAKRKAAAAFAARVVERVLASGAESVSASYDWASEEVRFSASVARHGERVLGRYAVAAVVLEQAIYDPAVPAAVKLCGDLGLDVAAE